MREFLKGLELEEELIDTVMAEHGKLLTKSIEKADKLAEQLKSANESLKAANDEIESFKKMDIDGVKASVKAWEKKYADMETANTVKIADMEYTAILKDALITERFSSAYARDGIMAEIRKMGLVLQDGKILGLEDAVKALKTSQPDAFAQEAQPAEPKPGMPQGVNIVQPENPAIPEPNPFKKDSPDWNVTKQARMIRDDPEKAQRLAAAAGGRIGIM